MFEQIRTIIADQLGVEEREITMDSSFKKDFEQIPWIYLKW